jgi:hypothetical protein
LKAGQGETEYFHAMLAATLVAPGHDKLIPLEPKFIGPQDGMGFCRKFLRWPKSVQKAAVGLCR